LLRKSRSHQEKKKRLNLSCCGDGKLVTEPLTCRSFPFRAPSGTWVAHRDIDAALDLLERCFSSLDYEKANWFKDDSALDALRSHPRYQKFSNASDENGGTLSRWTP
jgi:hypothetical protein